MDYRQFRSRDPLLLEPTLVLIRDILDHVVFWIPGEALAFGGRSGAHPSVIPITSGFSAVAIMKMKFIFNFNYVRSAMFLYRKNRNHKVQKSSNEPGMAGCPRHFSKHICG